MTNARLAELRAFIDTNPVNSAQLAELADALATANQQIAYYVRQLEAKYAEVIALQRQRTAPTCEDCGAEMVECGPDGEMTCRVCDLTDEVRRLRGRAARVDEDDERGGRR